MARLPQQVHAGAARRRLNLGRPHRAQAVLRLAAVHLERRVPALAAVGGANHKHLLQGAQIPGHPNAAGRRRGDAHVGLARRQAAEVGRVKQVARAGPALVAAALVINPGRRAGRIGGARVGQVQPARAVKRRRPGA
ncbi:hypothetical protein RZS08_11540, partial [Arthrospira platensis SPKY1]|nr:hypothetical protein [Arthrospira platensis SPKY1]